MSSEFPTETRRIENKESINKYERWKRVRGMEERNEGKRGDLIPRAPAKKENRDGGFQTSSYQSLRGKDWGEKEGCWRYKRD
jgi:hypothetical protein